MIDQRSTKAQRSPSAALFGRGWTGDYESPDHASELAEWTDTERQALAELLYLDEKPGGGEWVGVGAKIGFRPRIQGSHLENTK